jgi:aldose 1-epimerase
VELPAAEGRYGLDPNGLPIHGALPGLLRWEPAPRDSEDRVSARLEWSAPELLELFPFVHQLELEARAGDRELELITTLRATGDDAVPVSFGFHPYLQVPGAPRVEWEVSLGATERLEVDDQMIPTGARRPLEPRQFTLDEMSWDDGLAGLVTPPLFTVAAETHKLIVSFGEGFGFAQIYAPPGQDLICFEPMTAPTNALGDGRDLAVVEPGGEYRAAFTIAVSDN